MTGHGNRASRIFLYGYNGFQNAGDDLLFTAVAARLNAGSRNTEFVVRSLGAIPGFEGRPGFRYFRSEAILADSALPRWRRLLAYARASWAALDKCSGFIFCGGTLFHARRGSAANLTLIALLVVLARLRGAGVFALGAGVGPLPGMVPRMLMSLVLLLSRDFAVRDETSFRECKRLPGSGRARLTADLAFSLRFPPPSKPAERGTIGITVAASDLSEDLEEHKQFVSGFPSLLRRLSESGWQIKLLSFQELESGPNPISDSALFDRLRAGSGPWMRARVPSDTEILPELFEGIEMVVGMRFHGLVLAAMMGKPFVGLGRDAKLSDLCKRFSMPFVPLEGFSAQRACEAVAQVRGMRPSESVLEECRRLASSNFDHLGDQ